MNSRKLKTARHERKKMPVKTALKIIKEYEGKGKGGIIQAAETVRTAYILLKKKQKESTIVLDHRGWRDIDFKKIKR